MFKKIVWLWFSTIWKNHKDVQNYIKNLVDSWATEFFTWYNPPYWSEKFGFEVSPNGRFSEHEQITDLETLRQIVLEVHNHNFEIFINLNAWYYTQETFVLIQKMIAEFEEVWVDWIICWNISVLEYLKSINYSKKINISTIMALYNTESIKFFLENYTINKVILSREITLKEIENLVTNFPNTKFEVFWEWDFCRYNNWLCFAEHKYWTRDICTVVVNDLIFKKKFRADFKKILLNNSLSEIEKIESFDDNYEDIFQEILNILWKIELWFLDEIELLKDLKKIVLQNYKRVDLFFDTLKNLNSKTNLDTLTFFKALKILLKNKDLLSKEELEAFENTYFELQNSFNSFIKINTSKIKTIWEPKLKALQTALFYSKWDNLNLYSYLFFSKFPNIETVKFPTRWRSYNEKLKLIESVINSWKVWEDLIDRNSSLERTHYDLTYLFKDKLWFRKMINTK